MSSRVLCLSAPGGRGGGIARPMAAREDGSRARAAEGSRRLDLRAGPPQGPGCERAARRGVRRRARLGLPAPSFFVPALLKARDASVRPAAFFGAAPSGAARLVRFLVAALGD